MRTQQPQTEHSDTSSSARLVAGHAGELVAVWDDLDDIAEADAGRLLAADLAADVAAGRRQLWFAERAGKRMAVIALTEVVDYPRLRACRLALAGRDAVEAVGVMPQLEAWALKQGCRIIEWWGRPGWLRAPQWEPIIKTYRFRFAVADKDL